MIRICCNEYHFVTPVQLLISRLTSILCGSHWQVPSKVISWSAWGPSTTSMVNSYPGEVFTAGTHMFLPERREILDFNQNDVFNDIYGPVHSVSRIVKDSSEHYCVSCRHRGMEPWRKPVFDSHLPYRETSVQLSGEGYDVSPGRGNGWFFIEEEDEPKVSPIASVVVASG